MRDVACVKMRVFEVEREPIFSFSKKVIFFKKI